MRASNGVATGPRDYFTKDEGLFRSVDSEELITQPGILCLHIPFKDFRCTQQATKPSKLIRLLVEYRLRKLFKMLGLEP